MVTAGQAGLLLTLSNFPSSSADEVAKLFSVGQGSKSSRLIETAFRQRCLRAVSHSTIAGRIAQEKHFALYPKMRFSCPLGAAAPSASLRALSTPQE